MKFQHLQVQLADLHTEETGVCVCTSDHLEGKHISAVTGLSEWKTQTKRNLVKQKRISNL